ncbi:lysophospholipid acyltransferase family protein [Robiginitalea sp.]|nr:lysophospholipid acyltransferase family protein [Robiginitalea sp.]
MHRLVFLLSFPLLWIIAHTPFNGIYRISNGLYFLLYRVFSYRKTVVRNNLELVFPEKSKSERLQLEKDFFRHLCDLFLETIKFMGISRSEIEAHFEFINISELQRLEKDGKSVVLLFPHYANWEWAITLDIYSKLKGYGIYQPLANRHFDKLVRKIRSNFGTTLISTKETQQIMSENAQKNQPALYGIIGDQSPRPTKAYHWGEFLGIRVPMHTGAEFLAKTHNLAVVFLKVRKIARGKYTGELITLAENPEAFQNYQITDAFFRETERAILEQPQYYLWTHRRWKHRDKLPKDYEKTASVS